MTEHTGHRDPTEVAEALSAYWDALVGDTTDDGADAGAMGEVVSRLHVCDTTPSLQPGKRRQIWEDIMATQVIGLDTHRMASEGPAGSNGLAPGWLVPLSAHIATPPSAGSGRAWWRRMSGQVATAALLVVVLSAGLFAAGLWRPRQESGQPTGIPAVITAPATPTPGEAAEETLLEVTIPPELLPEGERITSEFSYLTMPAGSSGSWQGIARADWRGLRVHYVLDGNLTIRAEGDAHVLRAGGGSVLEEVPAGMEVPLGPGDTWMIRNETPYEVGNATDAPAQFLSWILANIADPNTAYIYLEPGPWIIDFTDPLPPGVEVPAAPVTLRIRLLELPIEGRLPAEPETIIQQGVRPPTNAEGTPVIDPSLGTLRSGTLVNIGRKPVTVYALSVVPSEAGVSTPQTGTPVS